LNIILFGKPNLKLKTAGKNPFDPLSTNTAIY